VVASRAPDAFFWLKPPAGMDALLRFSLPTPLFLLDEGLPLYDIDEVFQSVDGKSSTQALSLIDKHDEAHEVGVYFVYLGLEFKNVQPRVPEHHRIRVRCRLFRRIFRFPSILISVQHTEISIKRNVYKHIFGSLSSSEASGRSRRKKGRLESWWKRPLSCMRLFATLVNRTSCG
jgi:hypothetical protein